MFCVQGARDVVHTQHRPETVRQVRAGPVPGDRQRAAEQTQVLGQAHGEGEGLLQEDARLVLRRQCHHAAQVTHTEERRTCQADVLLTSCYPL